jgi:hypothetical protein
MSFLRNQVEEVVFVSGRILWNFCYFQCQIAAELTIGGGCNGKVVPVTEITFLIDD